MKKFILRLLSGLVFLLLTTGLISAVYFGYIGPSNQVESYNAFPDIDLDLPTGFFQPSTSSDYNYVIEMDGKLKVFENDKSADRTFTLLDLTDRVYRSSEDGLLGMTFHPDYLNNGKYYLYYSEHHSTRYNRTDCDFCISTMLSEFQVEDPSQPFNTIANSERVIIELNQTSPYHRGGQLFFDDQGMLFVHVGDGVQEGKVQDLNSFFGKILRINVDNIENGKPYGIPTDNPFYNTSGVAGEIYAYGLRNPWRGSIDPVTGNYWVGDVGKDFYEELNLIEPGKNYGWPVYEGNICKNNAPECFLANTTSPVIAYPHPANLPISNSQDDPSGVAVIAGHVYRGEEVAELQNFYIFADYTGAVYKLRLFDNGEVETEFIHKVADGISHISLGNDQELYIVGIYLGNILKLRQTYQILFITILIIYLLTTYFLARMNFPQYFNKSDSTDIETLDE